MRPTTSATPALKSSGAAEPSRKRRRSAFRSAASVAAGMTETANQSPRAPGRPVTPAGGSATAAATWWGTRANEKR